MASTLWDTTGTEVVQALLAERRAAGALASGLALTLVVVVDEKHVQEAEEAATIAAAAHPCRLLIVIRRSITADVRLDAEVQVGGRLGATEAIVMRMHGRLALHAESVVLPLLAPDAPVVTWWHGAPPEEIATDALGVFASRRITDAAQTADPIASLHRRAEDFVAGDTDLAWTRCTPWRSLLAAAFDGVHGEPLAASVSSAASNPSALLLAGWLSNRLGIEVPTHDSPGPGITDVTVELRTEQGQDDRVTVQRHDGRSATLARGSDAGRILPLARRTLGDLLAEELRRMDPDFVYAEALATAVGAQLNEQPRARSLVWRDPAPSS